MMNYAIRLMTTTLILATCALGLQGCDDGSGGTEGVVAMTPKATPATKSARTIQFPERSIGQINTRRAEPRTFDDAWKGNESAKGTMDIPAATMVQLKSGPTARSLDSLTTLQPDDLDSLWLTSSRLTDDSLAPLSHLTGLQILRITKADITDEGLKHLTDLDQVTDLQLGDVPITDAGLEHLKEMDKLQRIFLHGTNVTADGVRAYKDAAGNPLLVIERKDEYHPSRLGAIVDELNKSGGGIPGLPGANQ